MPATKAPSLQLEAEAVRLAAELMRLGARRPVVEAETGLAGERLTRLFTEVTGQAPARGQLPHSPDWFLGPRVWLQVALFDGWRRRLMQQAQADALTALKTAFRLYREEMSRLGQQPLLDFTRAWSLVRFLQAGLLAYRRCRRCGLVHVVAAQAADGGAECMGCGHLPRTPGQWRAGPQAARQARATASATLMPSTPADRMPPA